MGRKPRVERSPEEKWQTGRKASRAGTSRRRVGVTESLRICSIAGGMKPSREQRQRLAGEALRRCICSTAFSSRFLAEFHPLLECQVDRRSSHSQVHGSARPVCYQHSDGIHSAPRTNQTTEAKYGNVPITEAGSIKTQRTVQSLRPSESRD
jgi:hypothetical protein